MKNIAIPVLALLASSCANQLSTKEAFDPTSNDGLVVLNLDVGHDISELIFSRMDPETCHLTATMGIGNHGINGNLGGSDFAIDTFSPGVWVLASATRNSPGVRTIIKYDIGSIAFKVNPGEFIHVGKISITYMGASIGARDIAKLPAFMENYPNVTAVPKNITPWLTEFSSNKREPVQNCNPMPPSVGAE